MGPLLCNQVGKKKRQASEGLLFPAKSISAGLDRDQQRKSGNAILTGNPLVHEVPERTAVAAGQEDRRQLDSCCEVMREGFSLRSLNCGSHLTRLSNDDFARMFTYLPSTRQVRSSPVNEGSRPLTARSIPPDRAYQRASRHGPAAFPIARWAAHESSRARCRIGPSDRPPGRP